MAMERIVPSPEQERAAVMLRALGNPVRLAITYYIVQHPGCIGNDLVVRFGRAQATISQHLAILRRSGIIAAERDGHMTCYAVDDAALAALLQQMHTLLGHHMKSSRQRL
jgi:ArsR family transcriptional regulator